MARAFNIIVFLCCLGFVYFLAGQATTVIGSDTTTWFSSKAGVNGSVEEFYNILPFRTDTVTAGVLGAAALVGTIFFPNPYTIFALVATSLLTFYLAGQDLINSVGFPTEISGLFVILGFVFMLALLGWYKGNE